MGCSHAPVWLIGVILTCIDVYDMACQSRRVDVNLLRIPYQWLVVAIVVISIIGVCNVNSSVIDIWIIVVSGGTGYLLRKLGYENGAAVAGARTR
jgi:TctA family transporter